jgi:L-fuculose-phosphate aldolase
MPDNSEKQQIVKYGRLLYENGFLAGADGNLSIRRPDSTIFITPSGAPKGFLTEENLIWLDASGNKLGGTGKPSSETLMHLYVYKNRPEINACCHAHPPYSTALSIVGKTLPSNVLPEVIIAVGDIPLTEYAPPGTEAVPKSLEKFISTNDGFLLRNHGVLTIGRTMEEAYNRMETVEHYAKIIYIANNAGEISSLDVDEVRRLEKIRDSYRRE